VTSLLDDMRSLLSSRSTLPMFLRQLSTDEYEPHPYSIRDRRVIEAAAVLANAARARSASTFLGHERDLTAAGLIALNEEWGHFFEVPPEAVRDNEAAGEIFNGPETVVDVQTHFMAPHALGEWRSTMLPASYRERMPSWWQGLDDPVRYDLAAYLEAVFLKTENAVAVLTSGAGLDDDDSRHVFNDEMAATRALIDGLAGSGRLLNHSVVHANVTREFEGMQEMRDRYRPAGWKVYTMGVNTPQGLVNGWQLDDENGIRFLERARSLDVKLVCAHKGLSFLAQAGSPRDVGPAAKMFPDINFLIYHSGYETTQHGAPPEAEYSEQSRDVGSNRLIASILDAGVAEQGNVYAELGTTWFCLLRRPIEAAHVLGKLLKYLGPNNVIWGTDSIWYGAAQPLIDALRVFQIPDWMCEQYGYEPLTPEVRAKIFGQTAARVYGIDLEAAALRAKTDDLSWARTLIEDYERDGFAGLR
jgi:uncharacterized protein